jgi:hypothetical protein
MARRFGIDVRALLPIAVPGAAPVALSNNDIAGYLWETLSYFGCDDRVETIVRETAREEGFNDLVYDALVRRIERALEEGGFEVVKRGERGREMYADAQAGRYTDMEIRVVGLDQSMVVFRAHKCVVSAASPFLRATIEQRRTNMVGAELSETYEIREIPADVFRVCMELMYTGEVRLDAPMEPGLVAGLVLAADRLLIADDLLPLIGRELVSEASAPRVVEAVYMIHDTTQAARGLVDMCAMYIVRSLARTDQAGSDARSIDRSIASPLSPLSQLSPASRGLPLGAIYAVAGIVVNEGHERRYQDDEGDKWMMSVGTAVLACTGMKPWDLQARLIETGTPPNEYAETYSKTVAFAPASLGDEGTEMGSVSVGQREYTACVRKSSKSSKSSTTAGSVRITVAFSSSGDNPSLAPQLVTIRAAGRSARALMTSGTEHDLEVPFSELDSTGDLVKVEVEADPLFAICLEVIRLAVQEGPRAAAALSGLDTRVLLWILCGDFVIASYDAILREIASRPSEEDRVALMKAAVSCFGQTRYNAVSVSEITALLGSVPALFDAGNERMLGMMLSYAVEMCTGRSTGDPVRDQLMGLMECVAQGTRKSAVKPVQNSKRKSDAIS